LGKFKVQSQRGEGPEKNADTRWRLGKSCARMPAKGEWEPDDRNVTREVRRMNRSIYGSAKGKKKKKRGCDALGRRKGSGRSTSGRQKMRRHYSGLRWGGC